MITHSKVGSPEKSGYSELTDGIYKKNKLTRAHKFFFLYWKSKTKLSACRVLKKEEEKRKDYGIIFAYKCTEEETLVTLKPYS